MEPYSYQSGEQPFNLRLKEMTRGWSHYAVDFPSVHQTRYEENNTVRGEYYRPQDVDNAPLTILLHGMGDLSVIPCKLLARALAGKGIACFILYSVFHSSRMPKTIRNRIPALTSEEWFEGYQISVADVRQVIDWANGRMEIKQQQIAAIGISLGGFVSAIAMGIDERIKAGIFLVTGGNSEVITWKSKVSVVRKWANCSEAECHHLRSYYPQYLTEVADRGFENVIPTKECFLTDPMTFAYRLRTRAVLMINALWDEFIPREATLDFWGACGKPAISWFPATHTTIWLWYPLISRRITTFLRLALRT